MTETARRQIKLPAWPGCLKYYIYYNGSLLKKQRAAATFCGGLLRTAPCLPASVPPRSSAASPQRTSPVIFCAFHALAVPAAAEIIYRIIHPGTGCFHKPYCVDDLGGVHRTAGVKFLRIISVVLFLLLPGNSSCCLPVFS